MDPVSVGAIVAAMVARSADDTADKVVDGAAAGLGRLVGWLRQRFSDDGDEAGGKAVAAVVEVPDSPSRVAALATLLDQRIDEVEGFGAELEHLVDEARSAGVTIGPVNQKVEGDGNVVIGGVAGSTIKVTRPR
ncbi:MAG TPA: hypothetical protein VHB02_06575 [Acidimicrobiales bacterium]|nr:hypothetical protein [Acidimicrobiales bacterium]